MAVKLYDRQRQPIPRLRGYRLNTLNQTVEANDEFDLTLKSINTLSDVFSTMTPSDGQRLTYDTTNGWQAEAAGLPLAGGTLTGALTIDTILSIGTMKTGATQVAASAAADELWATASHATLPDNVVMIGV